MTIHDRELCFRFSEGAFMCALKESIIIGHSDRQDLMWSMPGSAAQVMAQFWSGSTEGAVLSRLAPASRASVSRTLAEMQEFGILITDAGVERGGAGRTPHLELIRLARPFSDIATRDSTFWNAIWPKVRDFTLTSPALSFALHCAVEYVIVNNICGDLVECGVGSGGSAMLMALSASLRTNSEQRSLWLYDTFGWKWEVPSESDHLSLNGGSLVKCTDSLDIEFSEEAVRGRIVGLGFSSNRVRTVKGFVQDTLQEQIPDRIAVLRLDTDFYESTFAELDTLYNKVSIGGGGDCRRLRQV